MVERDELEGRIAKLEAELEHQRYWTAYWKRRAEWYQENWYRSMDLDATDDHDAAYDGMKCGD